MQVSQKETESKDTLSLMISVMRESAAQDKKERLNGKLLKYIFEIRDAKNKIKDVICAYTCSYYYINEIILKTGLGEKNLTVRGPFPIVEDGLVDSKINRWKEENEKSSGDSGLIEKKIKDAKKNGYKYIYLIFDNIFGIERFSSFSNSDKAYALSKVNKLISSGTNRHIKRINLLNGKEKIFYE